MPDTSATDILILTEADLRAAVELDTALVDAIEQAFRAMADGRADVPAPLRLARPERSMLLSANAAFIEDFDTCAMRLSNTRGNVEDPGGRDAESVHVVFDADGGSTRAMLIDNGYLGLLATAATGALAARHVARKDCWMGGILGTGEHARFQAIALARNTKIEKLRVWGRDEEKARALVETLKVETGLDVATMNSAEAVVRAADVLVTATTATSPIVRADWLRPGLHITAVGAGPAKNELAPEVVAESDVYVADSRERCRWNGELTHAIGAGLVNESDAIIELGDIIIGRSSGRQEYADVTLVDLAGSGALDTAVAAHALQRAIAAGKGTRIAGRG